MRLQYLKDVMGNNYVGVNIQHNEIEPCLNDLKEYLNDDKYYDIVTEYQQCRDSNHWHVTVINLFEFNALAKTIGMRQLLERIDVMFKMEIEDLLMKGIGKADKYNNIAYFAIVESDFLSSVRDSFNLPTADFHCTIGFYKKDVHGVRKNKLIDRGSKFINTINNSYYDNNKTFEFINNVKNLETELNTFDIVSITESHINIHSNGLCYGISLLNDGEIDELSVVTKHEYTGDGSFMNQYQVEKVIGQKH